jgi:DNA helicase HerA-like ATPase
MARYTVRPQLTTQRVHIFGDPENRQQDTVLLGRLAEAGALVNVFFDASGEFVMGIFGKRGSGKSYCLGSILESLAAVPSDSDIGSTSRTRAVLVFDTLNIFWTLGEPLESHDRERFPAEWSQLDLWRIKPIKTDAMVFYPRGFGGITVPSTYHEFALPPSSLDVQDWADLLEVDLFSDRVGQLLFDVYNKVLTDGWSNGVESFAPNASYKIDDLLRCVSEDQDVASYYSSETVRALGQRLKAVGNIPFFSASAFELRELLRPGVASVLLLNRLPDTLRSVLVSVLMRRILTERSEASEIQKQLKLSRSLTEGERESMRERLGQLIPSTIVALDEAQNVLPSERSTKATQTIVKYVREGRNHGLSMVFTTQQPSAIDARILAQVDTIIGHKLTIAADVRRFEENQKTRNPDSVQLSSRVLSFSDWLRSLSQGQGIVSNTEESRNFVLDVRPRICPHGGSGSV